jgi:hypothetical protein
MSAKKRPSQNSAPPQTIGANRQAPPPIHWPGRTNGEAQAKSAPFGLRSPLPASREPAKLRPVVQRAPAPHVRTSPTTAPPLRLSPAVQAKLAIRPNATAVVQRRKLALGHPNYGEACSICLSPVLGYEDLLECQQCNHIVHTNCFGAWVGGGGIVRCPQCLFVGAGAGIWFWWDGQGNGINGNPAYY